MRKVVLFISVLVIVGCSNNSQTPKETLDVINEEISVEKGLENIGNSTNNSEVRIVNGVEIDFTSTSTDGYIVDLNDAYIEDNKDNGDQPLTEANSFNPVTKVEVGDVVETENGIFVTYEGYKIVDDIDGSGRKGIIFIHSRTNQTGETITFGFNGEPTATSFFAFHDDTILIGHNRSEEMASWDGYYLSRMVNYELEGVTECNEDTVEIAPGETSVCYNMINYIGPGEYRGYSTMYEDNGEGGIRKKGSRLITIEVQ